MTPDKPPEGWLYKAWDGDVLVDLIFAPRGLEMTDEVIDRGEEREVMAISVRLMAAEDVFATKLLSIDEHSADYSGVLLMARSLREQVDWEAVRSRTKEWPFAKAFFVLADELGVIESHADPTRARVRVVEPAER